MYVGTNPVIKKTAKMLRNVLAKRRQEAKSIPKRASKINKKRSTSKTGMKKDFKGRFRWESISKDSSSFGLRTPRRQASNPFLRRGLVGQSVRANEQMKRIRAVSPLRSQPPASLCLMLSSNAPSMPYRKASNPDMANVSFGPPMAPFRKESIPEDMHMAPIMPNRKPSKPDMHSRIIMTRSRS